MVHVENLWSGKPNGRGCVAGSSLQNATDQLWGGSTPNFLFEGYRGPSRGTGALYPWGKANE